MRYLLKFQTTAAYEAAESSLILPNVSLTVDNNTVHYKPSSPTPPTPTHDYVEIGGVKWATMNIGANSVTDTGLYFQWGDTQGYTASQVGSGEGQKYFGIDDYIYYNDGSFTKYNEGDGKITLESTDDAVTAAWGGGWRMPTVSEFIALGEAVNTAWTQVNGVSGVMCTDKTDETKTLFFPACSYATQGSVDGVGSYGFYWSSSLYADYGGAQSFFLTFESSSVSWNGADTRAYGLPVRGILDE